MEWLTDPQVWIAFVTLTALELVLGIDNIVFISILAGKLPADQQKKARLVGLGLAMFMRVGLLFSLSWIIRLTAPLFTVLGQDVSGRDLILIGGGLFLLGKSTYEIHERLEGEDGTRLGPCCAVVRRRHRADTSARRRLLTRFGYHCGRHGQRDRDHDRGCCGCYRVYDGVCRARSAASSNVTQRSKYWR